MEKIQKDYSTGVIVGRLQVDELTEGHIDLFTKVDKSCERTILFLGLSPCKCTANNPLDFQARKAMVNEMLPNVDVYYIHDIGDDVQWSDSLDEKLVKLGCSEKDTCLFGSRDSFIQYYSGKFKTEEIEQEIIISGTEARKSLTKRITYNADFRRGVLFATMNQWPSALPTIDVVIFNADETKILLGKKDTETNYRFIGGFVEPGEDFDATAYRETKEETNIDVDGIEYVKSFVINDWRYKNEVNKITTILYKTVFKTGTPVPGDDIHSLRWFPFNKFTVNSIMPEHREMLSYLLAKG